MDNWDDDDFDPTASMQSKLVDLGLDSAAKKEEEEKAAAASTTNATRQAELEALEEVKESDLQSALALMGLSTGKTEDNAFETLKTKQAFENYGNEMGERYKAKSNDKNYMAFALPLVKHLCENMTKVQLEEVFTALQEYRNAHIKKEQEAKKVEEDKKQKKETKKKKKQLHEEDMVTGDYADYEDDFF